mgnify:FL=1
MLKNYWKIALRNLLKNKVFFLINIFGLAIGLASFVLLGLYVYTELNYDRHHRKADQIYRLVLKGEMGGEYLEAAVTGGPMGPILKNEMPEVVQNTQIQEVRRSVHLSYLDKHFFEEKIIYADSSFFDVFDHHFVAGNPLTALEKPFSLVITRQMAEKIFGNENPMGKILKWNNTSDYVVTGIIENHKPNTHLQFDFYASLSTLLSNPRTRPMVTSLFTFATFNYVVVKKEANIPELQKKVDLLVEKHMGEGMREYGGKFSITLQPLSAIHLHSHLLHELGQQGDISRVYIFSAIAVLILIIACINFVNLSTARSSKRALETGIRKVFGANRSMLIKQFLGESVLVSILSLLMAIFFIKIMLPSFNNIAGTNFSFGLIGNPGFLAFLSLITLLVGFTAGIYPAFFLSSFDPGRVIKSDFRNFGSKSGFRNVMVTLQFIISVFLIFSTIVIYSQLHFIENKNLGFNKENLMIVPLRTPAMVAKYKTVKGELRNVPGVVDVSASSSYLGNFQQRQGYYPEGVPRTDAWMLLNLQTDYNFPQMMGVTLKSGRSFSESVPADSNAVLVNEALAKEMNLVDPVGHYISLPDGEDESSDTRFKIVGMLEDFNFASLHQPVKPLLLNLNPANHRYLNIRIDQNDRNATLSAISEKWETLFPSEPLDYFFLDQRFPELYSADLKTGNLFIIFTVIAIVIALMGLFGLVLYTTERRTREIGIRKVFGSSEKDILFRLNSEFLKWVLAASVIAWPLGWFFMNNWLENFAFRENISWWIFLVSTFLAVAISTITISVLAFSSARKNPVDTLRYE